MGTDGQPTLWHYDVAFGFYLLTGATTAITEVLRSEFLGALVSLFMVLPALLMMPVVLILSSIHWRDFRLLCPALLLSATVLSATLFEFVGVGLTLIMWAYNIVAIVFSIEWFFSRRWSFRQ